MKTPFKELNGQYGAPRNVAIFDNGGKTVDRYTAVFKDRPHERCTAYFRDKNYEALSFNACPYHPQGFGQHTAAPLGRHLGKRINLFDLPEDAQKFVIDNL